MSSQTIRNKSYTRRDKRDYHGYIHDRRCRLDSSPVEGGFKIHGYTSDLVVAIPAGSANRIRKEGPIGLQSTILHGQIR
ncbi:hypothetical protein PFICI_03324 [Pestalotiopsis fici W106-1]|uniref:Uncharacterized protein n=1 Tax=Pestalotiopsis fici (strain W106-1 / CGMCC3.15140) TaxID=1229662 RepID=W3XH29_PESFW|nr:uncharacterized protein PFICI_03324 [Pestalotiopsis fici W106-1]ETS85299.1 hypothetical protein PFICI_03324 [Pestalotiopsis fici W106-1]